MEEPEPPDSPSMFGDGVLIQEGPAVLGYAAAWFFFNLGRMPPYIP